MFLTRDEEKKIKRQGKKQECSRKCVEIQIVSRGGITEKVQLNKVPKEVIEQTVKIPGFPKQKQQPVQRLKKEECLECSRNNKKANVAGTK